MLGNPSNRDFIPDGEGFNVLDNQIMFGCHIVTFSLDTKITVILHIITVILKSNRPVLHFFKR